MSSTSDEVKVLLTITSIGGLLAWQGWKQVKRISRVKDTARQVISAASAGQVELEAIAWPQKTVETCIQGKKCVHLYVTLEEYKKSGKNNKWVEVWSYRSADPFFAFDHTGFVRVRPDKNTYIDVIREKTYSPGRMSPKERIAFNKLKPNIDIFSTTTFFGLSLGNKFRIKERKLLLGSPILIHGQFRPEDKIRFLRLDSLFLDFQKKCAHVIKSKVSRQKQFDRDRDGTITREELLVGFERILSACNLNFESELAFITSGEPGCRYYGTVSATEDEQLHLADTFEDQYLRSSSAFMGWMTFAFGLFTFLIGLYLFANRHKY